MVVGDEFQSPPFPTVHYTFDDTLEGLGCCEMTESVGTHSIWMQKVGLENSTHSRPENRL